MLIGVEFLIFVLVFVSRDFEVGSKYGRDRTNRLLLFRDRISNCTNLFRPEPNPNHTHRSVPHSPSDVHAHLTACPITPPSVHPSTKDRRYQHAIYQYLVLCGKRASVGKLYCPGNDCSRARITLVAVVVYSQQETTKGRR